MIDDLFYLRQNVISVDAAVVGISKSRWMAIAEEEAIEERAMEVMRKFQFDVLPVMAAPDIVREFYSTKKWNDYGTVERRQIDYDDVMPQDTSLRTVIKSMALEQKKFFFLTHEDRVTGLISLVNLNCRQVRIFLFGLISELEIALSQLIRKGLTDEEIIDHGINKEAKSRFLADKKKGVEPELMEYLYLSDLINLVVKEKLFSAVGYTSRTSFKKSLGSINKLRNEAAHPTKTLISGSKSVQSLWDKIQVVESALFRLRQIQNS